VDGPPPLTPPLRTLLLTEARQAVAHAAAGRVAALPDADLAPEPLRLPGNSFVTVMLDGGLRGCIGSLIPQRPLIVDVADNARRAATADPRFKPLRPDEAARVALTIAVLGPPQPLAAEGEAALIELLVPGRDGLILEDGDRRGLFLPKVWEMVPDPRLFLAHLRAKAGLPPDHWSPTLRVSRFLVDSFGDGG
jgi:AmmeMemoRadiSam system protein A